MTDKPKQALTDDQILRLSTTEFGCVWYRDDKLKFARAVLQAARQKPLTPQQYNAIPELCAIKPSLYESIVRAIERAHGITE